MKKILIVGGNGFVGRNLTKSLLEKSDAEIYLLDNLLSSDANLVSKDPRVKFFKADAGLLTNFTNLPKDIESIFLLHCLHGNQSSLHDPILDLDNSLRPTIATYEWVRREKIYPRLIYAGAGCAVAEKTWNSPEQVIETDLVDLYHDSPYSISKLAGEMHSLMYAHQFNIKIMRARFQNVYGPGEYLAAGKWRGTPATIWRNVVPTFIWKAIHNQTITVTGADASRDFIFIDDIVQGLISIESNGNSSEAYNLASGDETKIVDLARKIIEISGSKSNLEVVDHREWDNSGRRFGSTEKSSSELGFRSKTSLDLGLKETIDWTFNNRKDIQRKIDSKKEFLVDP